MPRSFDDEPQEDFGDILARFEDEQFASGSKPPGSADPKVGEKVKGIVVGFGEDSAFIDLGSKSEGVVALEELLDEDGDISVDVGDSVEAVVAAEEPETGSLILRVKPGREGSGDEIAIAELHQSYEARIPVEGKVTSTNKGGVDVEIAGLRAFCPISQLDLGYVEDAESYVGARYTFRITRFERGRGKPNIVVSRRELLAEEQAARAAEVLSRLEVGNVISGHVSSLAPYGAFVDLGGVEGLLHVSEISHQRIEDPADVLVPGQELEVEILKIEDAKKPGGSPRISLSLRSLEADPWQKAAEQFPEGTVATGKIRKLETFGAFVELVPGLDGLLHISELGGGRRINHPREVVDVGQELPVKVLSVDAKRRRISLGRAQSGEELEVPSSATAETEARPGEAGSGLGTLGDFFKK